MAETARHMTTRGGSCRIVRQDLAGVAPEIQALPHAVRSLVYDVLPQTVEVVWPKQGSVGSGTEPKKCSEHSPT